MAVDSGFIIGYGGFAKIKFYTIGGGSGTYYFIPLLSASVERNMEVPFATSYSLPFSDVPRTKIRLAHGTYTFSGSLNFELTEEVSGQIFANCSDTTSNTFFARTGMFDVSLCDGEGTINLNKCVWNSFSFSGSPNGLLNCSISFQSLNDWKNDLTVTAKTTFASSWTKELAKYWKYGNSADGTSEVIRSFNLNFSRSVVPVFLNNSLKTPTYLRPGLLDVEMQITCLEDWFDYNYIMLNGKTFTLLNEYQNVKNWNISGATSEGLKTFNLHGSNYSYKEVFTIT